MMPGTALPSAQPIVYHCHDQMFTASYQRGLSGSVAWLAPMPAGK